MSVLYPLIQALVLFAVAPLLSGITRVARARLHNRRGRCGCRSIVTFSTAGPPERYLDAPLAFPAMPDDGGRYVDRHRAAR